MTLYGPIRSYREATSPFRNLSTAVIPALGQAMRQSGGFNPSETSEQARLRNRLHGEMVRFSALAEEHYHNNHNDINIVCSSVEPSGPPIVRHVVVGEFDFWLSAWTSGVRMNDLREHGIESNQLLFATSIYLNPGIYRETLGSQIPEEQDFDGVNVSLTSSGEYYRITPAGYDQLSPSLRRYAEYWWPIDTTRETVALSIDTDGNAELVSALPRQLIETITQDGWSNNIIRAAREAHRSTLRASLGRYEEDNYAEEMRKREEHRRASAARFSAFRNAQEAAQATDCLVIPELPFVPHGLASSRRWGIEVESGGARGVESPGNGWVRKTDGSLRSAWDGYREVQDFEPYEEEITENISWYDCEDMDRHRPHEEVYDEQRGEYIWQVREDYLDPRVCSECGPRTRMVLREPQTIVHTRQSDDCAEFVSPILVSMHSNGLKELVEQLALQPQNATAGVHVHVEASDLSHAQINTLVYGYDLIERFVEPSYQREERNYCRRRDVSAVLEAARKAKADRGKSSGSIRDFRSDGRYHTVNTQALSDHGTIEFRAMGPVYDYEYLIRWAMFCREMVNTVKNGATVKEFGSVRKWRDVLALFIKYGSEYTRALVYEATGETGEAARLSKAGETVTTAALDADLDALRQAFNRPPETVVNVSTTNLNTWQVRVMGEWIDNNQVTARLVPGGVAEMV